MRNILRQLIYTAGALAGLYALILAITLILVPSVRTAKGGLYAGSAADTIYMTETKYIVMERSALARPGEKVIIVGASNTEAGFPPSLVQPNVPIPVVHNLAMGGANMTEVSEIVDLALEVQSPAVRAQNIFVIGMWYGMFCDNKTRWDKSDRVAGDTDIDVECYRYGFYRRTDAGPVPALPVSWLPWEVFLVHPDLALNIAARDITKSFRYAFFARPPERTDAERDATVLTAADKQTFLDYWWDFMGRKSVLSMEQFNVLEQLIKKINDTGGRVLLVDLPLPLWHSQGSPIYPDYEKKKTDLCRDLEGNPGVTILEMENANAEGDFSDEVHPKPRVRPVWARQLAAALYPLLPGAETR